MELRSGEPTDVYEFAFSAKVTVREPNEDAARHMASMRVEDGDFDSGELVLTNIVKEMER